MNSINSTNSKTILLLFPPTEYQIAGGVIGKGVKKERPLAPPLGLLYLATPLLEAGYNVQVVDFNAEDYSLKRLSEYLSNTILIGISSQSFNRDVVKKIIKDIKNIKIELPIIIGGPDCILHPRLIDGTILTVISEAEHTIVKIVDTILNKGNLSDCEGILFRDKDNKICNGLPIKLQPLDDIAFPSRHLVRDNKGYNIIGSALSGKIASLISSRGCIGKCRFCARGALVYNTYRERSAENVLDEIELIYNEGYEILGFMDDNFMLNPKRVKMIFEGIIERGIKLAMAVQGRVDCADEDLFHLMRKAGVKAIVFGLESGCQETLDFYNKKTTIEQNRYAIELADKTGFYSVGFFILGAPFEKEKHIKRTIDFAYSLPLDFATFWVLDYTYGSDLWNEAYDKGLISIDEFNVPASKRRGLANFTYNELEKICIDAFKGFYLRPIYWKRQIRKAWRLRDKYLIKLILTKLPRLLWRF